MKFSKNEIGLGETVECNGKEYGVRYCEAGNPNFVKYELENPVKFLKIFNWSKDVIFYQGSPQNQNDAYKGRTLEYNYRNIFRDGLLLAGCIALIKFAWNMIPAKQQHG